MGASKKKKREIRNLRDGILTFPKQSKRFTVCYTICVATPLSLLLEEY